MKYIFEVNSRPSLNESAEEKHNKLIKFLKEINEPWGVPNVEIPFPGFGDHFVASINLSKYIGKGIQCSVYYYYRNKLENNSACDDRIYIEFNPGKVDYNNLTTNIFVKFIAAFNAYRATVYNKELMYADFERSRNKNLRDTIIRFYPICFYDTELCLQALKMTPEEISKKLTDSVEGLKTDKSGIFLNHNSKFFSTGEANNFNEKIFSLLQAQ